VATGEEEGANCACGGTFCAPVRGRIMPSSSSSCPDQLWQCARVSAAAV